MRKINIANKKFGKLTAIKFVGRDKKSRSLWLFKCACGNEKIVDRWKATSGHTKSCGCWEKPRKYDFLTLGNKTYMIWAGIKRRCLNKNQKSYKDYGAKGIKICKRWLEFGNFLKDMGEKPDGMSIERIDNNGNYKPSNCRWATRKEQNRNYSRNIVINFNGEKKCLKEWSEILELDYAKIHTIVKTIRSNGAAKFYDKTTGKCYLARSVEEAIDICFKEKILI